MSRYYINFWKLEHKLLSNLRAQEWILLDDKEIRQLTLGQYALHYTTTVQAYSLYIRWYYCPLRRQLYIILRVHTYRRWSIMSTAWNARAPLQEGPDHNQLSLPHPHWRAVSCLDQNNLKAYVQVISSVIRRQWVIDWLIDEWISSELGVSKRFASISAASYRYTMWSIEVVVDKIPGTNHVCICALRTCHVVCNKYSDEYHKVPHCDRPTKTLPEEGNKKKRQCFVGRCRVMQHFFHSSAQRVCVASE